MVYSLWELIATALPSIALAAQVAITPLPQNTNYVAQVAGQLFQSHFSTDVTKKGVVKGEFDTQAVPQLQVFIINNDKCLSTGAHHSYRIIVQNGSPANAKTLVIQDKYSLNTQVLTTYPTAEIDPVNHVMVWRQDNLPPGGFLDFAFTLAGNTNNPWTNFVSVEYNDDAGRGPYQTATQHTLSDQCGNNNVSQTGPQSSRQPAIICEPNNAEPSCVAFKPDLGGRFKNAKSAGEAPLLGGRFAEAVADILPGECSVVADDIIKEPAYHDALNRQSKPAAFFMDPLYQSGQDFKRLVHENTLLGITNSMYARTILSAIHTKYWQKQKVALQRVLDGSLSTDDARKEMPGWRDDWIKETKNAQQDLGTRYTNMQERRKEKFDPVAEKAIENAKQSIQRACGQNSDGGLSALLPPVKDQYINNLDDRTQAYAATQQTFVEPNNPLFPQINQADTWMHDLNLALDAFDQGNRIPLEKYVKSIGQRDQQGFAVAFRLTYEQQVSDDHKTDEIVRLQAWEIALDTPKVMATECEKKHVFSAPVETTWCESGAYPELFGPQAEKARQNYPHALPPASLDGSDAVINNDAVKGTACSGAPGDPWWAVSCQCQCNEQVPSGQFDQNGNPILVTCQGIYPIVYHDITITSQAECLSDRAPHPDEAKEPTKKAPF